MENLFDIINNQKANNETQINNIIDNFSYSIGHVSSDLPETSSVKIDDTIMELKSQVNLMLSQQYIVSLFQAKLGNQNEASESLKEEVKQFRIELLELLENVEKIILAYTNGSSLNVSRLYDTSFPVLRYEDRSDEIRRIKEVYEETLEQLKETFEQEDSKLNNLTVQHPEENTKENDSYNVDTEILDKIFDYSDVQQPEKKQYNPTPKDNSYNISVSDLEELFEKQNIRTSGVQESVKHIRSNKESLSLEEQKRIQDEVRDLFS